MPTYRVVWIIDLEEDCREDAAIKARNIQLREESTATIFEVTEFGSKETMIIDTDELAGCLTVNHNQSLE